MIRRRAAQLRVRGEGILGLGHAHRVASVAILLQFLDLSADLAVGSHFAGAVDLGGNRLDLVPQCGRFVIDKLEAGRHLVDHVHHRARQILGSLAAFRPMPADDYRCFVVRHFFLQQFNFRWGVEGEMVDRHHARQTVVVANIVDVPLQVGDALAQGVQVFLVEFFQVHAAMEF